MIRRPTRLAAAALTAAVVAGAGAARASAADITGPSSSLSPYLLRSTPGVVFKSILSAGDTVPNSDPSAPSSTYRMAGIPDGLGALRDGKGSFTLLMNHELRSTLGVTRAHGGIGSFVSKWNISKGSLRVNGGQDLIKTVLGANGQPLSGGALNFNRFCSADLAPVSAFYNAKTRKGFGGRLFLNGEESANSGASAGRAFAHELDGTSTQLPALGRIAFENVVANPGTGDRTVAIALDDSGATDSRVYVYVGDKRTTGSNVEKAGLAGGKLLSFKVGGLSQENDGTAPDFASSFTMHDYGDASGLSGDEIKAAGNANGVTTFNRPEDGAWDPNDPNVFYFVTTANIDGNSRLWKITFKDAKNPSAGGTIEALLNGDEGNAGGRHRMLDNITVNERGQIILQEDPGNNPYIARIWLYTPRTDTLTEIAHHDASLFQANALTQDEESSGVIDASDVLGEGWYLLDVQAHYAIPGELVEGGQLLAMHVPPGRR